MAGLLSTPACRVTLGKAHTLRPCFSLRGLPTGTPRHAMPGYQTKQERVAIAGVDDLVIRSLLDRQQFADPLGEAADLGISSASWPLFGLLWASGTELAVRLARRPVVAGERILEVGCGLALASLVGHRRGADMTASDSHPLAGDFLLHNQRLNAMTPVTYRHGDWGVLPAVPMPNQRSGHTLRRRLRGRFDLIIGSDLLYDRDHSLALAGFIVRHARPQAEVWIVDPDRGNRSPFNRVMASQGFVRTEERLDRAARGGIPAYKGRMLTYVRRSAAVMS
jgi:predicted nicotinamide N-methyase